VFVPKHDLTFWLCPIVRVPVLLPDGCTIGVVDARPANGGVGSPCLLRPNYRVGQQGLAHRQSADICGWGIVPSHRNFQHIR
jgi:hypothetical protein